MELRPVTPVEPQFDLSRIKFFLHTKNNARIPIARNEPLRTQKVKDFHEGALFGTPKPGLKPTI